MIGVNKFRKPFEEEIIQPAHEVSREMVNKHLDNLKRFILYFKKLTPEVLKLLVEKYPDGYEDKDIISFRNAQGENIDAVEVVTPEIKYLVKISVRLVESMENFDEDDYDDIKDDDDLDVEVDEDDVDDDDMDDIPDDVEEDDDEED